MCPPVHHLQLYKRGMEDVDFHDFIQTKRIFEEGKQDI